MPRWNLRCRVWLRLFKPYDCVVLLIATTATMLLAYSCWRTSAEANRVVIRVHGIVQSEWRLPIHKTVRVQGALGITQVQILNRQVRIESDPGPRQICVQQGWLTHAGDAALCAPNHVFVELQGSTRRYDSIVY